jgi:hypothetical protein
MKHGFVITRVSLRGPSAPAAEVEFRRGLNAVIGPSDTGKTFIGQCIDYALGSGKQPKRIPEAEKYDQVELALETADGSAAYVLQRGLEGGAIRCFGPGGKETVLGERHRAGRADTVSGFLLQLCGLLERRVRTNQQGSVSEVSFRDLAQLALVDEVQIQSPRSPIFSGERTDALREARVFRVILTGNDDSAVIKGPDPKIVRGQREGKHEVVTELLEHTKHQLKELGVSDSLTDIRDQVGRLQATVDAIAAEVAIEQRSASELEEARRDIWRALRESESRENVLGELRTRFVLLREQYSSDFRRLEAIAEAGGRLSQMAEDRCPVCGALKEHASREHQHEHFDASGVAAACKAESEKIVSLLGDLEGTLRQTSSEIEELSAKRAKLQHDLAHVGAEIRATLQPRLQAALGRLKETQQLRESRMRVLHLLERVEEYEAIRRELSARPKATPKEPPAPAVRVGDAAALVGHIETMLKEWHLPGLNGVAFSDADQDVVISGRDRATHGKGVLALTHAAFTCGLLRFCNANEKPFTGFVLTDSPLVVYQEPDPEEKGFPLAVKDAFYRSLAQNFSDSQVIVFENDGPPDDVAFSANTIHFTGSADGRRGFIP